MKSFYEYLAEAKREYKYRIKIAAQVTDELLDRLEYALRLYDVVEVGKPTKSIIQDNPLDFPELRAVEVWTIDVTLERAVSTYTMMQQLRQELNVPEDYIVVRDFNEPKELENVRHAELNAIEAEADKDGMEPVALLDHLPDAEEYDPSFGDEYNQKLLDYLSKVRAEGETEDGPAKTMFGLLKDMKDVEREDFNKDKDGVKPAHIQDAKGKPEEPLDVSAWGNFDSRSTAAKRTYKKGERQVTLKGKK